MECLRLGLGTVATHQRLACWAGKMIQWIRSLAKPGDLSLIPGSNTVEEENQLLDTVISIYTE